MEHATPSQAAMSRQFQNLIRLVRENLPQSTARDRCVSKLTEAQGEAMLCLAPPEGN